MKSREGDKKPCHFCGTPTRFQFEIIGPRGAHLRWVDCCIPCGEDPARRATKAAA